MVVHSPRAQLRSKVKQVQTGASQLLSFLYLNNFQLANIVSKIVVKKAVYLIQPQFPIVL